MTKFVNGERRQKMYINLLDILITRITMDKKMLPGAAKIYPSLIYRMFSFLLISLRVAYHFFDETGSFLIEGAFETNASSKANMFSLID